MYPSSAPRSFVVVLASVALVVCLVSTPVAAQTDGPDWADDLYADAEAMVDVYNQQVVDADLGRAAGQLTGETVNLAVTDERTGETVTFSFRMDDQLRIQELDDAPRDDATLGMTTNRATLEDINEADQPSLAFRDAVRSRDIEIGGETLVNRVKWTVINVVGGALGLFD